MREKLFKKGTMRRLFSIVLALAMVLSLMPMNAQLVYAAGGSKTVTIDTVIPKEELDSKYDQRTFYDEDKIISIRNTRNPLCLSNGIRVTSGEGAAGTPLAISSLPGYTITKIEVTIGMSTASVEDGTFLVAGDKKVQVNGLCLGKSFAIDGLNSESLTVTTTGYTLMLKQIKVTFTVPNHTHNYESGWTSNDDYHWHACTGEGNTESCILMTKGAKEPHTGGTATCYSKKVCSVCGREYGELLPHNYEYTATGNVLTATCQNPGCSKSESLTLSPKYYSGEAANISKATILGDAGFDDFNSKIDNNLSESNFKIYNYADVEKDNEITGNITQKGIYIAELSKDGQTADIAFDVYQNHKHDLVYEAIGDTLIAYCNAEPADHVVNCDIVGEKASVTLTVDPEIHTGITVDVAKSTIFENTNFAAYNEKLGENLSVSNIKIYRYPNNKRGSEVIGNITARGDYLAELVVPNAPAATTTFKVIADHIHDSLTYSASGDTLTATCESGDCYLASNKVSIKLSATSYVYSGKPATVCTDGTDPGATIKYNFYDWMYANAGDVIVKYVGRGNTRYSESSTPPTKIGTYTVKLYPASEESTPTNIASADFEIKRKSVPSGCNKVVDFGTRDWEYTIYKFGKYTSNVNGDAKGNFTDFRFYNITGSTVTYSVAGFASTSDAEYSGSLSSSTITTLLSGLKVTDGVGIKCAYSAATHVVTMTPITHSHTLDYTVSGGTITAKTTCHTNEHCEYRSKGEKTFTLTLEAKSLISYGSETYSATLSNKAEWTSAGIPVSTIQYFKATSEGGTEGTEEVTNLKGLPQGNYYAQVTVGSSANGTATVKVPFKIFPPHVCNGINFGNKFPSNGGSLSAGNYCLTEDVTLTKSLTIDGNVNLCLNGHVLKGNGIAGVIKVNSGKTLSIYDCGTATEHRGTLSDDGYLWTWDGGTDTGDTVIKGGIITGGAGQYGGVYSKGIIKMYGGSIAGNQTTSTYSGAGVYMDTDSKFTMYGGEIKYNKSTEDGGGIYVKTGCNLDIQGGRITNNYAADDGGGLYSGSDTSKAITICLTDGEISNNKAADDGGGIYLEASAPVRDGQFKMKGGSITDNIAGSDGGGICAAGSNWYMYKGTISGNTAADKGGGVYQGEGMMVKINIQHEGVINITGNTGSSGTKVQNLYLTHNDFISSDFNESSRIGLTLEDPYGSFSEMTEVQDWDIMFSSDEPYKYQIKNKSSGGIEADTGVTSKSHKWEYSENGNVLSAKCKGTANGCTMPSCGHDTDETAVKLTLTATDSVYSGNNVTANYGKGEAAVWKTVVGTDAPTISYQYRATEGGTYSATAETKDVGYYIASATVDTNKTATAEFKITKATQAAPAANVGYTIDYEAETITANEGYEVSTSNTELAAPVEGKAIPGDKYYIRKQGDDNNAPSSWTTITAPLRPEGPAGINYVTPTTAEGTDGAITGVSSLMEYRRSTSDEWTAIVSTEITYLSVGTYVVRYKATETAFASEVTTIEVCAPHVHAADTAKKHDAVPGTCKTVGTLEYYECTDSECHAKVDASGNELDSIVGSLDSSNHEGTATTWTKTSASHVEIYDCCGAIKTAKAAHSGGTATCNTKAICDVCKAEYGSFADHDYGYSVTGNVLSVACKNSGCNDSLSLNLSARGGSYSGSPVTPTIIFGDYGQQNAWTSAGLTVPSVGNENVKVMYFETANGSKSGTGSETAPINVGSYIASVAYQYGEASTNKVTVDVPFTVNKAHGVGSVTVSNWAYGASASVPVVNSTTNGTTNVNYKYKVKGADDSTYTSTRPTAVGEYTIKAIFAATSNYAEATATSNFAILKAGATTEMSSASAKLNLKAGSTKVISFTDLPEGASIGTPTGVISGVSAVIENNALKLTVGETDLAAETTPFYVEIHIGESTNYMQYDIIVEVTPTLHNHSYSYSTTGAKIIAKSTCHAESECEYENTEKTVELSLATANATYSGSPVSASLEGTSAWTTAGLTAPKINYEGTGSTSYTKSVTAPTNAGSYKATITAGGKTAEKTFSINKKEIAAEDVSLSPSTFVYDGAEKTVTVNVSSDLTKDVDYTVTGTTKATALSTGDGYAVTVTGKGNYTGSVTKYWTITKEPIAITTAPTASGITYGQKLSDSTLTGGNPDSTAGTWTWVNPSTQPSVSDSGVTEYDVKFTPNDTNYGPNTAKVTLTVEKSTPAAPNAVGVAPTAADATDGKVVGVDTTMEYAVYDESSSSYGAYQNVSGTAITDFAAGTKIKVRVKASDNTNTGADKEITIPSYTPPAPPAPPAPHTHIYATTLSSDDTYHWYAATCGHETVKDKETHKWDAGKVTKEVTDTVKGEKTFTCTVCKKTKVEEYSITEDKPAPEEYTIPVKSEDSIQVSASISEGTADVAEITEKDIEKVVGKDDKTANDTVTIDLSGAKQEVTGVTLSKTTVNVLAKATADTKNPVDFVEVKMTNATLQLDSKALTAIGDQAKGKEIKLVVDDTKQENLKKEQKASLSKYTVATTFEAYVECDNTRIHDFKGGNVVVNIAFTPEKGKDIKHYHVYYVADDGTMTHYSTRLKNGILQFTTTHFSDYAVIYDEKNENDTDKTPEDSEDKTPDEPGDEPGDVKPDNPSDEPGDEPTTEQNPTTEQAPTVITPAKMEKNTLSINSRLKVSQTKKQINVTWGKVSGATGYKVYASYCGSKFAKPVKTTKSTSCTIKKLNGKALNLTKNFKVRVVAYKKVNGKEVTLGKTITAHVVGKNNKKYTNAKSIKLAKRSFTLKKGKTAKIVASTVLVDSKKHQLTDAHAKEFRYASSNKAIATVSKTGVIKAKKKGTCTVYVYARNGYAKTIKVIVK